MNALHCDTRSCDCLSSTRHCSGGRDDTAVGHCGSSDGVDGAAGDGSALWDGERACITGGMVGC